MSYLENIGKKSKKAFEDLKTIKHEKIKKVLESYNKSLLINKQKIIRENKSDIKNVKRNNLVDRLILNDKRIDGIRHSINEIANFKRLINSQPSIPPDIRIPILPFGSILMILVSHSGPHSNLILSLRQLNIRPQLL